jgi:vacuolar-type H+-ATPase subunit E/Vma4
MNTPSPDASGALLREILEEASRKREEILDRARQSARARMAKAEEEAQRTADEQLQSARAEAQRRKEAILATVPVEAARLSAAHVEELLQSIHDAALKELQGWSRQDFSAAIVRLAVEALESMTGDSFVLRAHPATRGALGNDIAAQVRQRSKHPSLKLTILPDPALRDGEMLLQDAEGRQQWNIIPEARLKRLWPELRRQIAAGTGLLKPTHPERHGS